ncbi:hypothetical protein NDU88_005425 [Pleurodeles waltl]|uniref:Uncharacterized protein n=1 Tax=Pleurodeles waltl TaxID=8319 RepID=A0AAV7UJY3_PLEWA|nr:hypothetical protein NDU88_005425 [Pleurodeles waltl]
MTCASKCAKIVARQSSILKEQVVGAPFLKINLSSLELKVLETMDPGTLEGLDGIDTTLEPCASPRDKVGTRQEAMPAQAFLEAGPQQSSESEMLLNENEVMMLEVRDRAGNLLSSTTVLGNVQDVVDFENEIALPECGDSGDSARRIPCGNADIHETKEMVQTVPLQDEESEISVVNQKDKRDVRRFRNPSDAKGRKGQRNLTL